MNLFLSALVACAASQTAPPLFQLVESAPIETTLDHADIPNAAEVWPEMVAAATKELCFAEFYASDKAGSALESTLKAIESATARGVHVRFLLDQRFAQTYPEIPKRLDALDHTAVRFLDLKSVTGGVLHAKYFVVDAREAYLGSQNFDWRSLEHIQELGVHIRSAPIAAELQRTFELDWELADPARVQAASAAKAGETSVAAVHTGRAPEARALIGAGPWLVASPRDLLAPGTTWDLPQLVRLIDGAREHIRVQLLTYKMSTRDDGYWDELESALRRAAARSVKVELLVADWCKRKGTIEGLQGLEPLENVTVKLVTIPPWSGGFVPYARVVHAKYMVVDGARAWLGTSNWERDYFYSSRNVGLVVEDAAFAAQLERFFADGWNSSYATPVDPCATYVAPKIGD